MVGVVGVEGVVPPEPVQGLSGSPGSGLKKPPRSLGRRGRESQRVRISRPTPDKLPRAHLRKTTNKGAVYEEQESNLLVAQSQKEAEQGLRRGKGQQGPP